VPYAVSELLVGPRQVSLARKIKLLLSMSVAQGEAARVVAEISRDLLPKGSIREVTVMFATSMASGC